MACFDALSLLEAKAEEEARAKGYVLSRLAMIDLFPDTLHAETVARFDKR